MNLNTISLPWYRQGQQIQRKKERKKERNEVKHYAHAKFIISGSGKTWDCNPLPFVLTLCSLLPLHKKESLAWMT